MIPNKQIRNIDIFNLSQLKCWWIIMLLFVGLLKIQAQNHIQANQKNKKRPKVGLVLSGGGAKGFAHIGVLKVLRDAGVEVDYISGTSMGSIVGGLYAIGYSPEFIENLVRSQNWNDLLLDKINRRNLSIDQKAFNEQQFISFPVSKEKVSLPFGIKHGQNISALLADLTSPVYQIRDFKDFQTPFLCIGTDISNGESVLLDHGNLADAMRASMAIPTVFTPIELEGRLLVDGGLVNNFPAKELAERGCDIIIGVDVQSNKDYTVSDLSSITAILDRSAGFYRRALNDTAAKYVDYYIHPDITNYSVSSFQDYDSIMMRGERKALEYFNKLKDLGDYLKSFPDYKMKEKDLQPLKGFLLDSVIIECENEAYRNSIENSISFEKNTFVSIEEVHNEIEKIYGGLFFNTVKYKLVPSERGAILVVRTEEAEFGSIGLGLHYDPDFKAGLLLTGSFRNVLIKNTVLETTLGLSENPHMSIKYYRNRGLKPGLVFKGLWSSFSFIEYLNGKDKNGVFRINNMNFKLYTQSINKESLAIGVGAQLELTNLRRDVGFVFNFDEYKFSQTYFNFFAFANFDSWDHTFFPTKGVKANLRGVFVTQWLTGGNLNFGETATVISGEYNLAVPINNKWTIRNRWNAGLTLGDGYYYSQLFILGGQGVRYLPGMISFMGLDVAQLYNRQMVSGRLRLQYNIFKRHFVSTTLDLATLSNETVDLFIIKDAAIGYGITWGYDSIIGPIEFSVMGSNFRSISAFFNLGFWF